MSDSRNGERSAPPVSLVMLAFNQEAFIEEAIAAALVQDYPNLQIVLSDDGSSDATMEIMKQAKLRYTGPHTVVVNQTSANRGILSHFYEAVALSSGQFIVAAAGDDISVPYRVSRLVEEWQKSGADAVFSTCIQIDAESKKIADGAIWLDRSTQSYFPGRRAYKITGAMAGYDRKIFDLIELPNEPVLCEDVFLSLMIHYMGGSIIPIHESLVMYRSHDRSLTNIYGDAGSIEAAEIRSKRLAADLAATLGRFQRMVEDDLRRGKIRSDVDLTAVRRMKRFYEFSENWTGMALFDRLRRTLAFRKREQLYWSVPRLFGLPVFVRIKVLQRLIQAAR